MCQVQQIYLIQGLGMLAVMDVVWLHQLGIIVKVELQLGGGGGGGGVYKKSPSSPAPGTAGSVAIGSVM